MAQKTIVTVLDDLDETPGASTVTFGLDGRQYEIDLSDKNAAKLSKALAPYIEAGRRAGGRDVKRAAGAPSGRTDLAEVRSWAKKHGLEVADRGRIAASVFAAYDRAH